MMGSRPTMIIVFFHYCSPRMEEEERKRHQPPKKPPSCFAARRSSPIDATTIQKNTRRRCCVKEENGRRRLRDDVLIVVVVVVVDAEGAREAECDVGSAVSPGLVGLGPSAGVVDDGQQVFEVLRDVQVHVVVRWSRVVLRRQEATCLGSVVVLCVDVSLLANHVGPEGALEGGLEAGEAVGVGVDALEASRAAPLVQRNVRREDYFGLDVKLVVPELAGHAPDEDDCLGGLVELRFDRDLGVVVLRFQTQRRRIRRGRKRRPQSLVDEAVVVSQNGHGRARLSSGGLGEGRQDAGQAVLSVVASGEDVLDAS
mmetsp:Transcript_14606/g.44259  ORF Transcript_14606/g.44259 Transcript_14606/m.44259 type:complete len:313 (-) Transcript_14606:308-1246(-)